MEYTLQIRPYMLRFFIAYALGLAALGVLLAVSNIKHNYGMSSTVLLAAGYYVATFFVKQERRVPDENEKFRLAWGSMLASIGASALLAVFTLVVSSDAIIVKNIILNPSVLDSGIFLLLCVALFIIFMVTYLLLALCYGRLAKNYYDALVKKKRI